MKKKVLFIIICIIMCLLLCIPSFTYATDVNSIYDNPWGDTSFQNKTADILGLVQVIGYTVAIIMAVVIGIRYILTSPEGKADIKKTLTPYLIGCLILTAGTVIVSAIAAFSHENVN